MMEREKKKKTMKMKNKIQIDLGDPSGDGHSICNHYNVMCNKTDEEILTAYNTSVKLTDLTFTHFDNHSIYNWQHKEYNDRQICVDYENSVPSELAVSILKEHGIEMKEEYEDESFEEDLLELFFNFIKLSLPDLEYKIEEQKNKYGLLSIGYGLYY